MDPARSRAEKGEEPMNKWTKVEEWQVPEEMRFDSEPQDQGQICQREYGTLGRTPADSSRDPYMRTRDLSEGTVWMYWRRAR